MKEIERREIAALIPKPSVYSEPFWKALNEEQLFLQKCQDCGKFQYPPGPVCSNCLSENYTWVKVSGKAKVWSKVGMWKKYLLQYPDTPYYVVLAELKEDLLVFGRITKENYLKVNFDSELRLVYYRTEDNSVLIGFEPV